METKTDAVTGKLPIEEAMKIQEALNPLGYIVYGYKQEDRPGKITIFLEYDYPFVKI